MIRSLSILLFALLSSSSLAVLSTFDTTAEGWETVNVVFNNPSLPTTVNGAEDADWTGEDGAPAGSLLRGDTLDGSNDWRFFSAPASFLGDQSSAFGTDLTYDAKTDNSDGVRYPAVILRSASTFLFYVTAPPQAAWGTVALPLVGASWSTTPDGLDSTTDAVLTGVLAKLDGLYIDADWYKFPTEKAWLDNVNLRSAPVPEPATSVALGLAGLTALRRRRRS